MVPGSSSERHVFSAFVDDSTVFLQEARQLPRVLDLVATFGKLSGLTVQPSKSQVIFLNTAVSVTSYEGIPVLQSGATTRYLGHQVGTGDLADANWAVRIRTVQRRLATATRLATSVTFRAQILNVILLPGILYTAAVFDTPAWADRELRNLQKQFLWRHSLSTETSRHKVTPGLLYTPRAAGGIKLISIIVAVKAQRI
uniref:Reverse transcriptase domain-containing protein n=1 Tax=Peronospora matthiolae TaxID=2874970 RepID=A0AAV1TWU4_9STRA